MAIIAVVWIHARDGASYVGFNFDYWVVLRVAAAILPSLGTIWVTRRVTGRPIASKYLGL